MRKFVLCLFIFFNYGCEVAIPPQELSEDSIPVIYTTKSIYQVKETGWTVLIPGGWEIIPQENIDFILKNRNRLYQYSLDMNMNDQPDNLIYIRKKNGSSFYAWMKPYNQTLLGNYDDYIVKFHSALKDLHLTNNIHAEYQLGAMRLGDIMFDRFSVKINSPVVNDKPIQQTYFLALVNGIEFVMTITLTEEAEEETLLNII